MIRRQVDPAQLRGAALDKWYRRSPEEIEAERSLREQAEYDAFFGMEGLEGSEDSEGSWQEARLIRPVSPPVSMPRPTPRTGRAGIGIPAEGEPRQPGAPGSFFGTHSTQYVNPTVPAPLDHVEPSGVKPNYYVLSDGSIESADEVERIYAEQQRRIRGQELAPSPYANAVDRLADGQSLLQASWRAGSGSGIRRATPTADGNWMPDGSTIPSEAKTTSTK